MMLFEKLLFDECNSEKEFNMIIIENDLNYIFEL